MHNKVELRSSDKKGGDIFSISDFKAGDTVMVGTILEVLKGNHSHASQVDEH